MHLMNTNRHWLPSRINFEYGITVASFRSGSSLVDKLNLLMGKCYILKTNGIEYNLYSGQSFIKSIRDLYLVGVILKLYGARKLERDKWKRFSSECRRLTYSKITPPDNIVVVIR